MKVDDYQREAFAKAFYPDLLKNIDYPICGLIGETGELAEQIKKMIRDDGGKLTDARRLAIKKEAGDVLWYMAAIASERRLDLSFVLQSTDFLHWRGVDAAPIVSIRAMSYYVGRAANPELIAAAHANMFSAFLYLVNLCHWAGLAIDDVAQANLDKLNKRIATGTLGGSGSDREERAQ